MKKEYVLASDGRATFVFNADDFRVLDPKEYGLTILDRGGSFRAWPRYERMTIKSLQNGRPVRLFVTSTGETWTVWSDRSAKR